MAGLARTALNEARQDIGGFKKAARIVKLHVLLSNARHAPGGRKERG